MIGQKISSDWNPLDHPKGPDGKFVKKGTGTYYFGKVIKGIFKTKLLQSEEPVTIDYTLAPGDVAYKTPAGNVMVYHASAEPGEQWMLISKKTNEEAPAKDTLIAKAEAGLMEVLETSPAVEVHAGTVIGAKQQVIKQINDAKPSDHDLFNPPEVKVGDKVLVSVNNGESPSWVGTVTADNGADFTVTIEGDDTPWSQVAVAKSDVTKMPAESAAPETTFAVGDLVEVNNHNGSSDPWSGGVLDGPDAKGYYHVSKGPLSVLVHKNNIQPSKIFYMKDVTAEVDAQIAFKEALDSTPVVQGKKPSSSISGFANTPAAKKSGARQVTTSWGKVLDVPANAHVWISKKHAYVLTSDGSFTLYTGSGEKSGKHPDDAAMAKDIKYKDKSALWWNEGSIPFNEVQAASSMPSQIKKDAKGFMFDHPVSGLLVSLVDGDTVHQHKVSKDSFLIHHSNGSGTFIGKNGKAMKAPDKALSLLDTNYSPYWAMPGGTELPPQQVSSQASKSKPVKSKPVPKMPGQPKAKAAPKPKPAPKGPKGQQAISDQVTHYTLESGAEITIPPGFSLWKIDPNNEKIVATGIAAHYVLQPKSADAYEYKAVLADGTQVDLPKYVGMTLATTYPPGNGATASVKVAKAPLIKVPPPQVVPTTTVFTTMYGDGPYHYLLKTQLPSLVAVANAAGTYMNNRLQMSGTAESRIAVLTSPEMRDALITGWSTFENNAEYYKSAGKSEKVKFSKYKSNLQTMIAFTDFMRKVDAGEISTQTPEAKAEYALLSKKMHDLKFTGFVGYNAVRAYEWAPLLDSLWTQKSFVEKTQGLGFDPYTADKPTLEKFAASEGFANGVYLEHALLKEWTLAKLNAPNAGYSLDGLEKTAKWQMLAANADVYMSKYAPDAGQQPTPAPPSPEQIAAHKANDAKLKGMPQSVVMSDGTQYVYDKKNGTYVTISQSGTVEIDGEPLEAWEIELILPNGTPSSALIGDSPTPFNPAQLPKALLNDPVAYLSKDTTYNAYDLTDLTPDEAKSVAIASMLGNSIGTDATMHYAIDGMVPWSTPSGAARWKLFAESMYYSEFHGALFSDDYGFLGSLSDSGKASFVLALHNQVDLTPWMPSVLAGESPTTQDVEEAAKVYINRIRVALQDLQQDKVWAQPSMTTAGVLGPDVDSLIPAGVSDADWKAIKALMSLPANSPEFIDLVGPEIAGMTPAEVKSALTGVTPSGKMFPLTAENLPEGVQKALLFARRQSNTANKGVWALIQSGAFFDSTQELYISQTGPMKDTPLLVPPGWSVWHVDSDSKALFAKDGSTTEYGYYVLLGDNYSTTSFTKVSPAQVAAFQLDGYVATQGAKPLTSQDAKNALGAEVAEKWDFVAEHEAKPWGDQPSIPLINSPGEVAFFFKDFLETNEHEGEWEALEGAVATMPDSLKWVVGYASVMKQPKILALVDWKLQQGHYAPLFILGNAGNGSAYAKYMLSGQIGYKDIQGWDQPAVDAYALAHGVAPTALAISQHIHSKTKEKFVPPSKVKDVTTLQLTHLANHKSPGGAHSKELYADQYGEKWMAKAFPTDSLAKARVDAEHNANVIGRLFGFNQPQTTISDLSAITLTNGSPTPAYGYAYVQHLAPAKGDLMGVDPLSISEETLMQAMEEHVLDWLISNHDSHGENLMISKDGVSVIGIDKGQAFKWFGQDKLAVGYRPSGNPWAVWYDSFYEGVQSGKIDKATADAVTERVLRRAFEVQQRYDEKFRGLLEKALEKRKDFGVYKTREAFIDAVMARKAGLFDDFAGLYKGVYAKSPYEFTLDLDALRVQKVGDAHVTTSAEFTDDVQKAKVHGVALMVASKDLEDAHLHLFTTQAQNGDTTLRGEAKVREDGDANITAWLQAQTVTSLVGATPQPTIAQPTQLPKPPPSVQHVVLPGLDAVHNIIVTYAKTVSAHATDGEYNTGTVSLAQDTYAQLKALRAQVAGDMLADPLTPPKVGSAQLVTHEQAFAWLAAADQYLMEFDHVTQAHEAKVKVKAMWPDEVPYSAYEYTPTSTIDTTGHWEPSMVLKSADGKQVKFATTGGGYFASNPVDENAPLMAMDKSAWEAWGDSSWVKGAVEDVPGYSPKSKAHSWVQKTDTGENVWTEITPGQWTTPAHSETPLPTYILMDAVSKSPENWTEVGGFNDDAAPAWIQVVNGEKTTYTQQENGSWKSDKGDVISKNDMEFITFNPGPSEVWIAWEPSTPAPATAHTWTYTYANGDTEPFTKNDKDVWTAVGSTAKYTDAQLAEAVKDAPSKWKESNPPIVVGENGEVPSWVFTSVSGEKFKFTQKADGSWAAEQNGEEYASTQELMLSVDAAPELWAFIDPTFDGTSVDVVSGAKVITVTKRQGQGYSGNLNEDGVLVETGGSYAKGHSGYQYDITFGDTTIEYKPWMNHGVEKSQQGSLRFTVRNWDGNSTQIDEIVDVLSQMGLDIKQADAQSLELHYWRHLYGVLNTRMDDPQYEPVKAYIAAKYPAIAGSGDEAAELDMLREAWALAYGKDRIEEITKTEWYRPRFSKQRWDEPDLHTGKPYWFRPEGVQGLKKINSGNGVLQYHSFRGQYSNDLNDADAVMVFKSGLLAPTEERMRLLGQWKGGGSSEADQGYGSASFIFTRLLTGFSPNTGTLAIMRPEVMLRTSNFSLDGDNCGDITKRKSGAPFEPKAGKWASSSTITGLSGPETQVKNGIAFTDMLGIRLSGQQAKTDALLWCAAHGITEINGAPVAEFFHVGTQDWKAKWDEAYAKLLAEEGAA